MTTAILTTGCANRPESITAAYTSHERYMGLDCNQLVSTMQRVRSQLALYFSKQNAVANLDAGGFFLFLIPLSAFAGDSEAEVAKWKGRVDAIEIAQIKKECKVNDI